MSDLRLPMCLLAIPLTIAACAEPDGADLDGVAAYDDSETWIAGELLDSVVLGEDHFVEFWEAEPGVVFVRESAPIADDAEDGPATMLTGIDGDFSVVDLYRIVTDNSRAEIPLAIRAASARVDERSLELAAIEPAPELTGESTAEPGHANERACSPDYFNDNYGASWFFNNYCTEGTHRWCPTNYTGVELAVERTTWWKGVAMAADHWAGALYTGWYYVQTRKCIPFYCWDEWTEYPGFEIPMAARKIEAMVGVGVGYRDAKLIGNAPCPKVHFAKLVNL